MPVSHKTRSGIAYAFLLLCLVATVRVSAQDLNQRVLIVYDQSLAESENVAWFYADQRNIPPQNFCPIAPPSNWLLSESDYNTFVKSPIQQCLSTIGPENILYIVLSYGTPYLIDRLHGPYAIDSYVADIWDFYPDNYAPIGPATTHGYYAESQGQGGFYQPFVSFSDYRHQPGSDLIYSVWRLDGPTSDIAMGLVTQAIQTEQSGGPVGLACFDRNRGDMPLPDVGYSSGEWDLHRAAEFASAAGYPVMEDSNQEEFGTPPAQNCPNAALYSGWYSLNNYNDAFTWNMGAIGWHLDSASAADPRGGTNWAAQALQRGITVTTGAVNEPFLEGLVRPAGTIRNLLEGANAGDAFLRNTRWLKWMILNIGDPLYRPFIGGRSPFNATTAADSLEIEPRGVVGGERFSTGIIHLGSPAPEDGVTFALSTSDPGVAWVEPSVTIPAGSDTGTFVIGTVDTTVGSAAVITAQSDSSLLQNTIETDPLLGVLLFEPGNANAIDPEIGTVYLNDVAPVDVVVSLTSEDTQVAAVPDSLVIPAGASTASFPVSISPVSTFTAVQITATYEGATVSQQVRIYPAPATSTATSRSVVRSVTTNEKRAVSGRTSVGQIPILY